MMHKRTYAITVILLFVIISCFVFFYFYCIHELDIMHIKNWKDKYQHNFLENNPSVNQFSIETGKTGLGIFIRGTISDWKYLKILLSNLKANYCLGIEAADDLSALRLMNSNSSLIIGIKTDSYCSLGYKDLSFLRKTNISNVNIWYNVTLNSLSGIEDCNVRRLAILDAADIMDYHILEQTNIECLVLKNAKHLSSLKGINRMKRLKSLTICGAKISALSDLAGNKTIEDLSVSNSNITDLTPLSSMKRLTALTIMNLPITNLEPLSTNYNLQYLYISGTLINDLSPLAKLHRLKKIHVDEKDMGRLNIPTSMKNVYVLRNID